MMRILTLSLVLTSFCFPIFDKSFEKRPLNTTTKAVNTSATAANALLTATNTPVKAANTFPKPLLLASFDEINLQSPASNYATEWRDALKQNAAISDEQSEHKKYWSRDFLLHLNQWTRELVAAHNVPPRVLPDSSGYGVPNAANPSTFPRYPFANPPYASRVFAYVSVAQYDALLVAVYYQDKFKGTTPSVSADKKPSYPSEEAAALMSTLIVLKALFPAEVTAINERGAVIRQTLLQNKKYVLSDIVAGEQIGQQVAEKALARAQSDGMSAAQSRSFVANTDALTWKSRQKPVRPTIEPYFGTVKAWLFSNVADYRPVAPPSVNSDALKQEIETVKQYIRMVQKPKMTTIGKWADPEFTATPVGHWNTLACDLILPQKLTLLEQAQILAHLNRAMMDATIVCWEAKTYYMYPRPAQVDNSIIPLIPQPNFPSYPSGHSTFSATAATVLSHFFPDAQKNLWEMAEEASESRIYAGLHYKMDCTVGIEIGKKIGRLAVEQIN